MQQLNVFGLFMKKNNLSCLSAFLLIILCSCDVHPTYPESAIMYTTKSSSNELMVAKHYVDDFGGELFFFKKRAAHCEIKQTIDFAQIEPSFRSGISIVFNDRYLCVGADAERGEPGAVLIFTRDEDRWTYLETIKVADWEKSNGSNLFGESLSLYDDQLVCGASWGNAVYCYKLNSQGSRFLQKIELPDELTNDSSLFGKSVSLSSSYLVVGSPGFPPVKKATLNDYRGGNAFIFKKNNSKWTLYSDLRKSLDKDDYPLTEFGNTVSLSEDRIMVSDMKRFHVFGKNIKGEWKVEFKIKEQNKVLSSPYLNGNYLATFVGRNIHLYEANGRVWKKVMDYVQNPKKWNLQSLSLSEDYLLTSVSNIYAFEKNIPDAKKTKARVSVKTLTPPFDEQVLFEVLGN